MKKDYLPSLALASAWMTGGVLAAVSPEWPFPGAPLTILMASAVAWHVWQEGFPRPRPAVAMACVSVAVLFVALAFTAYACGRVSLGFAFQVSGTAVLLSVMHCLVRAGRASDGKADGLGLPVTSGSRWGPAIVIVGERRDHEDA